MRGRWTRDSVSRAGGTGDDAVFQAVLEQLRTPLQTSGKEAPMLLMSLVAFVVVGFAVGECSIAGVLGLVTVPFLREMGHAIAFSQGRLVGRPLCGSRRPLASPENRRSLAGVRQHQLERRTCGYRRR